MRPRGGISQIRWQSSEELPVAGGSWTITKIVLLCQTLANLLYQLSVGVMAKNYVAKIKNREK